MYNVTTEDIKKWNNLTVNEISLGQQLVVGEEKNASPAQNTPSNEPATENIETSASTQAAIPRTNAAGNKVHVVAASQGLSSIARMYNIPVENLKQWNNLTDNNLKVGQELLLEDIGQSAQIALDVPGQTQQESSISQEEEAPKKEEQVAESAKPRQAETTVKTVAETKPAKAAENRAASRNDNMQENSTIANTSGFVKKVEAGLAEVIDSGNTDMFLALHRTAPVGTIMQVRNQMNDLSVFVKVIGRLPDTGANDKVVVKISRKAYERLAAIDKRFRVELSYMP
jgi:LysM repeat protein